MTHSARYPSPLNARLLWPLGKLLQPSCRVWCDFSVQTSIVTRECSGVPFFGLHRAIRSGLGRPTEFFTTSVRKVASITLIARPRTVTLILCAVGRNIKAQKRNIKRGRTTAYPIFHTVYLSAQLYVYCSYT